MPTGGHRGDGPGRGRGTDRAGTSARWRWLSSVIPAGSRLTRVELVTIAVTYFSVGVATAVVLVEGGTDPWVVVASAALINAATTQLAYVATLDSGGSQLAAVLGGWLVATRFGLLAGAIAPRLWTGRWQRPLAAFNVFDPNTAIAAREDDDDRCRRVFTVTTIALVGPWLVGATVGAFGADRLGDPTRLGLDAVLPALLLAIIWPALHTATGRLVAGAAAVIALALFEVTPGGVPAIAAVGAAALALRNGADR